MSTDKLKQKKEELLGELSQNALNLFKWVRDHEHRNDWAEIKKAKGRPSPKQRIVEYVRELLPEM